MTIDRSLRKQTGAWYTPFELVNEIVTNAVTPQFVERFTASDTPVRVLDPACGDGRFLDAAARRIEALGAVAHITGIDVDTDAIRGLHDRVPGVFAVDDALARNWSGARFDLVVGNPPFLSQMSAQTTRGGAGERGAGPYGDAAAEFLALAAEVVEPNGGRVAMVLPQSLLSSRDASAIRRSISERATFIWTTWSPRRVFDAQVYVCALAFEFGEPDESNDVDSWSWVVTGRLGIPGLPPTSSMTLSGSLGDRARLNANFRDEYYGMVPAVGDHPTGPPLVTSGLVDPGHLLWGERTVTFARQRLDRPRVNLELLEPRMQRWAEERLVPKVLIANQTRIIEAVCDPTGELLPGVPVVCAYPNGSPVESVAMAWEMAAVLTSAVASAWAWHESGGTGLSANTIRLGPATLSRLPWPKGDLSAAVRALSAGDVRGCSRCVSAAYGVADQDGELNTWWESALDRVEARRPRHPGDPAIIHSSSSPANSVT